MTNMNGKCNILFWNFSHLMVPQIAFKKEMIAGKPSSYHMDNILVVGTDKCNQLLWLDILKSNHIMSKEEFCLT